MYCTLYFRSTTLAPRVCDWKAKEQIISLTNNISILVTGNKTTLGQENWACIFVEVNAQRISKLYAYCFILMVSFLGNIFFIIIFYKRRDQRKAMNYFIVNMGVSDIVSPTSTRWLRAVLTAIIVRFDCSNDSNSSRSDQRMALNVRTWICLQVALRCLTV